MPRLKGLILKQTGLVLSSRQIALSYALLFALLPYCAWLAMTVVALVTLRQGEREGGRLLLWVMVAHSLALLTSAPLDAAVINTLIVFVPCYVAAYTLRISSNWQAVAGVLFLLVILSALLIQLFIPEWVSAQYALIQAILKASQPDHVLAKWMRESSGVSDVVMANYAFGIQLMSAVLSVLTSLMMARSWQSQLFYPGGFAKEMLGFRGSRLSFSLFAIFLVAAWQFNTVAMNVIPVLALFYMLAGLSFCANLIIGKVARLVLVILVLPLVFLPFVMLPLYIMLGLLDSVFNVVKFRRG